MFEFELIPHDDVTLDLERLNTDKPDVVDRVVALIEQLLADPELVDDLLRDGYGGSPSKPQRGAIFNVRAWGQAQKRELNLWRARDFELSREGHEFRIVYAVFAEEKLIYLLAVVEREWNYDFSHPISRRILNSYRNIEEEIR